MTATATTETINLNNPTEVLASCLLKTHALYLELLNTGFASDLYKEVGKTVRALAQNLSDVSYTTDADDFEEEEQE